MKRLLIPLLFGLLACGASRAVAVSTVSSPQQLDRAIAATLTAAFPRHPPVWELARQHNFPESGQVSYRLLPPENLQGGRNWFQLRSAAQAAKTYLLPVDVYWEDSVWVAVRPLRGGQPVRREDMARRFQRHTQLPQQVRFPAAPIGLCAARAVGAGAVLTHQLLAPPPVVARGHIVRLIYEGRGLRVCARAEALENGALGETIRVRPLDGRQYCKGIVRTAEEVEVIVP